MTHPSMPGQQGQSAVIDWSFLNSGPPLTEEDEETWCGPLNPEQVAALLEEAARSAGDYTRVSRIQIRLDCAMQDGRRCPCPAQERSNDLNQLFVDRYREGADPGLVAEICRLLNTSWEPAGPLTDQRFTVLDGLPDPDDPELTVLMERFRQLPPDQAATVIEGTLRCALGYRRTRNPAFLSRLASAVLTTFRPPRPAEDGHLAEHPRQDAQ